MIYDPELDDEPRSPYPPPEDPAMPSLCLRVQRLLSDSPKGGWTGSLPHLTILIKLQGWAARAGAGGVRRVGEAVCVAFKSINVHRQL